MEFRDYVKIYWSQRWFILILALAATLTAYLVASTRPVRTGVSLSFAVNRTKAETTNQYQ
jgi:uncharacterized protein involved in exopolysaccharide biosynthesis